jgi:hypothetical protein
VTCQINLACRDSHGNFAGEFDAAEFLSEVEFDCLTDGDPLEVAIDGSALVIDGQLFRFKRRDIWHGNWCWDAFHVSESTARRLHAMLISKGWVVTEYVHGGMFDHVEVF